MNAAILLAIGCAATLPPLYPSVAPVPPPQEAVPVSTDDVPGVGFYIPGRVAPFVDDQCRATGRGQVLPQSDSVRVIQLSRDLAWWQSYGMACYNERAGYETSRQNLYSEAVLMRRRMIWGTGAGVGVGLLLGFLVGVSN
jgi:hypothetical protein